MWRYRITDGEWTHDGVFRGTGYSGIGEGLNNPNMQSVENVGPIPIGKWTIGQAYDHPKLGPICFDLFPHIDTETFGRNEFRIHADRIADIGKHLASHGCIILIKPLRLELKASTDRELEVIE